MKYKIITSVIVMIVLNLVLAIFNIAGIVKNKKSIEQIKSIGTATKFCTGEGRCFDINEPIKIYLAGYNAGLTEIK